MFRNKNKLKPIFYFAMTVSAMKQTYSSPLSFLGGCKSFHLLDKYMFKEVGDMYHYI